MLCADVNGKLCSAWYFSISLHCIELHPKFTTMMIFYFSAWKTIHWLWMSKQQSSRFPLRVWRMKFVRRWRRTTSYRYINSFAPQPEPEADGVGTAAAALSACPSSSVIVQFPLPDANTVSEKKAVTAAGARMTRRSPHTWNIFFNALRVCSKRYERNRERGWRGMHAIAVDCVGCDSRTATIWTSTPHTNTLFQLCSLPVDFISSPFAAATKQKYCKVPEHQPKILGVKNQIFALVLELYCWIHCHLQCAVND